MNAAIETLLQQILTNLQELPLIKRANSVAGQISGNERVAAIIDTTKAKQKELVQAKTYKKAIHQERLEQELDQLKRELTDLPIVAEHERLQAESFDLLQSLYDKLWQVLVQKLPVETFQIPPGNCSTGGSCKCSKKGGGCGK